MDVLSSLLTAPRGRGVFVLRSDLVAPWALGVRDRAPLTLLAVARGSAVLIAEADDTSGATMRSESSSAVQDVQVSGDRAQRPPAHLDAGDVVLLRGPSGYVLADAPTTPEQAVIGPGQTCTKPDGSPLSDFRDLDGLAWTNVLAGQAAQTVLLTGTYEHVHQVSKRVLEQLPPVVVVRAGEMTGPSAAVLGLLLAETRAPAAAQSAVLDRLVDLLLVTLLRARFADPAHRPPWFVAQEHPVVGVALRCIHHEPHRAWTLESLAREAGVSRATLARTFREVVGQPPMAYLSRWRLDVATHLLGTTDLTLASIAERVGYASAYSLSHAYSRDRGHPPTTVRRLAS